MRENPPLRVFLVDSLPPARVLVVDPCPDNAASLALLLCLWGHEVHEAPDGPAALEASQEFRPQVVLTEVALPGLNGGEAARSLRERGGPGSPPLLVALTGYGRERDRRRSEEAGFDHHLVKPAEPAELLGLLAAWEQGADAGTVALRRKEGQRLRQDRAAQAAGSWDNPGG